MNYIAEMLSETQLQSLQHESPTPLYFQLYNLLKNAILDGTIENGTQLPTERTLAEMFAVSRITTKRAVDELAIENLVNRRRGKGTYVTYEYSPQPVNAPLIGLLQEIESTARHSDVKVFVYEKRQPPASVRDILDMGDEKKALHLIRVRSLNGQPFGYYDSWTVGLPNSPKKREFKRSTRLEVVREQGVIITHVTQTISAVTADEELARKLEMKVGGALISLIRHSFETRGKQERLIDYLQLYYHPDRFQYSMDLRLDDK